MLKKRQIGSSELYTTEIGLGCMSLGTNEANASAIVQKAIELGVNFFDTADLYDFGLNEELVGKAIKGRRQDIILATKVGNKWNEDKTSWTWKPTKDYIKTQVHTSLKRLNTDYIDLYQLHGGTLDDPIDDIIEAFEDLKNEGTIRYYGISSIRPNVIYEYVKRSNIISVMMQYSILDRRCEEQIFSLLQENNISIIARGPVAKGIFSENWQKKSVNGYLDYTKDELLKLIPEIQAVCPTRNLNEIAIKYCLHSPVVANVIPGASSIAQLHDNINTQNADALTNDEYTKIQIRSKANRYESHRI